MKIQNGFSLKPLSTEAKLADQETKLKSATKMYENYFLNEMVKAMRSTVGNEEGVVKANFAEKLFTEQLDQQYVEGWANKGGVGLADLIYNQIKEKYFGTKEKHIHPLRHTLPLAPKLESHGLGSPDSIQMKSLPSTPNAKMSYRFEVPNPSGAAFEVQAPMAGKVTQAKALDDHWNIVRLDHGQGLHSELTFPGHLPANVVNTSVEPGHKLGILDPSRPVLAWNLDWT